MYARGHLESCKPRLCPSLFSGSLPPMAHYHHNYYEFHILLPFLNNVLLDARGKTFHINFKSVLLQVSIHFIDLLFFWFCVCYSLTESVIKIVFLTFGETVLFVVLVNHFVFYHCTVCCHPKSIWKLQFNCNVCNRCLCKHSPAIDGRLDIYLCTINLIVIFQACMTTNGMEKSSVLYVFVFALLCKWVCNNIP